MPSTPVDPKERLKRQAGILKSAAHILIADGCVSTTSHIYKTLHEVADMLENGKVTP